MFGNDFYNSYTYQPYYQSANTSRNFGRLANSGASGIGKTGLLGLLSKFNFSSFLNGASKTLNVVNQAIPVFYQVRPIFNNAKTMFKIMSAVKDDNHSKKNITREIKNNNISTRTQNNTLTQRSTQNTITYQDDFPTENPVFFI